MAGRGAIRLAPRFTRCPDLTIMTATQQGDGYHTDDHQTVEDLLALVLGVLSDVPDIRGRDVYIAGAAPAACASARLLLLRSGRWNGCACA